jgi:hypothetical protein
MDLISIVFNGILILLTLIAVITSDFLPQQNAASLPTHRETSPRQLWQSGIGWICCSCLALIGGLISGQIEAQLCCYLSVTVLILFYKVSVLGRS